MARRRGGKLVVATCQFPVSADLRRNARYVGRQMREAARRGARVVHFPEGALSGYAGVDFRSFRGFDWPALEAHTREVQALARELRLWVMLGSSHRLSGRHKPHNSVYVVDARGELVDRYDKRFCAGDRAGRTGDLSHYTPGNHFCVVSIDGVRCGVQICHEYRYPELYRAYKRRGVELVFHSYHAGNVPSVRWAAMRAQLGAPLLGLNPSGTLPGTTMPPTMQAAAASSHVFISCANSSARESCWPAFTVRPDGVITGRLRRNVTGVLITTVDTRAAFYDGSAPWRRRAMDGIYHSGRLVEDPRSRARRRI